MSIQTYTTTTNDGKERLVLQDGNRRVTHLGSCLRKYEIRASKNSPWRDSKRTGSHFLRLCKEMAAIKP